MSDIHYWDEDNLVPATDQEMRDGMREAMAKFAHLLPAPHEDVCGCFTCRSFRSWLNADLPEGESANP